MPARTPTDGNPCTTTGPGLGATLRPARSPRATAPPARILVVEDEQSIRLALYGLLQRAGHAVQLAGSGEEAAGRLAADPFDLVLTDLALGAAKRYRPDAAVVMITAHGSERTALEAVERGADDYVPKPFDNDALRLVVARALEKARLAREHRRLLARVDGAPGPPLHEVVETLHEVADARVPFSDAKRRVVTAFERAYLLGALRRNGGNVSRTARTLGMVRQSLQQKIREHDLRSESWARGRPAR